jgi:hypothetical protein
MQYQTVGEIARRNNVPPRLISDLFYSRRLEDARCPIVSGRRLVPSDYVPEVERVIREAGGTARRMPKLARA